MSKRHRRAPNGKMLRQKREERLGGRYKPLKPASLDLASGWGRFQFEQEQEQQYQELTLAEQQKRAVKAWQGHIKTKRKAGRKRKRGVRKGSLGAIVGGAKRTKVTPIKPSILPPTIVNQTRKAVANIRARQKAKYITATAISMRHTAHLIEPDKPFSETRTLAHGLQSTAIVSFEYYPTRNLLILVWWKNWKKGIKGSEYAYFDVPHEIYEGLLQASSKGRFVYYNIRTSFKYMRL